MDFRKPKVKLFAGVAVVTVVGLIPGVIALPGQGPPVDGSSGRVEAGAPAQRVADFATGASGPITSAGSRTLKTPPLELSIGALEGQIVDFPVARSTEALAAEGEGAEGSQPAVDGQRSEAGSAPAVDGGSTLEGRGEATTTSTAAPGENISTARPSTAPPPSAAPVPSGGVPGADQRELYVDGARGSGSNPGTKDKPFRRPIEATSIARPGTTIYLRGGTYDTNTHGAFNFTRSGTAGNWIRVTPYPGERVELRAGGEWGNGFEFRGSSFIELSGFVIRGRDDSVHGNGVLIKDGAHDIRVVGNQISNFGGGGISLVGGSRVTIERNDVRENAMRSHFQGSGISLFKPSGPVSDGDAFTNIIRGNYVVHNYNATPHRDGRLTDGNCIIIDRSDDVGYQGRTLIENNVCAENGGRGVHMYNSSNVVARNNTLYHNMQTDAISAGRGELTAGNGRNITFYNNLVVNRSGIASFINNNNQNTSFHNNYVASGPPPGDNNQVLSGGASVFRDTARGGPVDQFRPNGVSGTADGGQQSSEDLTGRSRPSPGAVGALEP